MVLKTLCLMALLATAWGLADDIFLGQKNKAGLVPFKNGDDMFYWLFQSRNDPKTDPLTIWLSGGPGCSSELATFIENGPFYVNDDLTLRLNEHSWSNNANLLYVDQPVGTGFSNAVSQDHLKTTEEAIADDFYQFLLGFVEQNPEFEGRDLYITGESYAGHYIPAISANLINQKNLPFKLVGLAIGNGWTDPRDQYIEYPRFSYENKLIGEPLKLMLDAAYMVCQKMIDAGMYATASPYCEGLGNAITGSGTPRFNVYDISKPCSFPPLCYDTSNVDKFLAREDVLELLGVKGRKWSECSDAVYAPLAADEVKGFLQQVADSLAAGVKVLVYSGDKDWICNWRGGENWTRLVKYDGAEEFNKQDYKKWEVNSQASGEYKEVNNFIFLRFYDAGHLVPMDQPARSFQMLNDFLY